MIKGSRSLGARILQWHGGQSSACYLVGSRWHSGLSCSAEQVRDCKRELGLARQYAWARKWLKDVHDLSRLLDLIDARKERKNPRTMISPLTNKRIRIKSIRVLMGGTTKRKRGGVPGVKGADGVWRRNPAPTMEGLKRELLAHGFSQFIVTDDEIQLGGGVSLPLDNSGWPCGAVLKTANQELENFWEDDPSLKTIARRAAGLLHKRLLSRLPNPGAKPCWVRLAHCPNPDICYGSRDGYWGDKPKEASKLVKVSSFREAAGLCMSYIANHGLGSGNWAGGEIYDCKKKQIAHVSYNGRVWPGRMSDWKPGLKDIKV